MLEFNKDFNHSYWETKQYFQKQDLIVIGAGIVGLSTAISYKEKHKKAKVMVLERGVLPSGASTKNAGFACFGSPSELLDDLSKMEEQQVNATLRLRWEGLSLLRKRVGDRHLRFQALGGYELFMKSAEFEKTKDQLGFLNDLIKENLGLRDCYRVSQKFKYALSGVVGLIYNSFEGQIDSGEMMKHLLSIARSLDIQVLNHINVSSISDKSNGAELNSDFGVFKTAQCVVATNGFAHQLLRIQGVEPARAQVLITSPIEGLQLKGSFHFDKGYYYFRNVDGRLLFGGGRNLDFKTETTTDFGINSKIQTQLDTYLKSTILPGKQFTVEQRWSGIMGVGSEKIPIIKNVSPHVLAVVRMGGMGIAIGTKVGDLAVAHLN